jgi:hypothetical protein
MFRSFIRYFITVDSLKVYGTAFAVQFLKIICRYIIKSKVFAVSSPADNTLVRAANFDCMRIGLDLAILGLVSVFTICQLAVLKATPEHVGEVVTIQTTLAFLQFALVVLAVLFLAIYDSPELSFKRGIWIPNVIGMASVVISTGLFYFLATGHY